MNKRETRNQKLTRMFIKGEQNLKLNKFEVPPKFFLESRTERP